MISQKALRKILYYNPDTGDFVRRIGVTNQVKGKRAGTFNDRYIRIRIGEHLYLAHRLAWLYVYGRFPRTALDHINRDKHDNRISNLRKCTQGQNKCNSWVRRDSKSRIKGVEINGHKFRAKATWKRIFYHLGNYVKVEDAIEAYNNFARVRHGQFYVGAK